MPSWRLQWHIYLYLYLYFGTFAQCFSLFSLLPRSTLLT
jgi:hypothetical protein